ncbi:MAG: hypothetical protein U1F40_09230 [Turneriella sp.]
MGWLACCRVTPLTLYQFDRLRVGISTANRFYATPGQVHRFSTQNRAMLGYFWQHFSLAIEGGATHMREENRWFSASAEGAFAASAYWGRWGATTCAPRRQILLPSPVCFGTASAHCSYFLACSIHLTGTPSGVHASTIASTPPGGFHLMWQSNGSG